MPFGVWTVCLHPNTMTEMQIESFAKSVDGVATSFASVEDLTRGDVISAGVIDAMVSKTIKTALKWKVRKQDYGGPS